MKGFIEITDYMMASDPDGLPNDGGLYLINVSSIKYLCPYGKEKTVIYLHDSSAINNNQRQTSIFICEEDYDTVKKAIEASQI